MAVIKMNFLSQALGMQTNVTICLPTYSFADAVAGRQAVSYTHLPSCGLPKNKQPLFQRSAVRGARAQSARTAPFYTTTVK